MWISSGVEMSKHNYSESLLTVWCDTRMHRKRQHVLHVDKFSLQNELNRERVGCDQRKTAINGRRWMYKWICDEDLRLLPFEVGWLSQHAQITHFENEQFRISKRTKRFVLYDFCLMNIHSPFLSISSDWSCGFDTTSKYCHSFPLKMTSICNLWGYPLWQNGTA